MTRVDPSSAFCELCGARGATRAGDLEECPRCGVLVCAACRPSDEACRTCDAELRMAAWRAGLVAGRPEPGVQRSLGAPGTGEDRAMAHGRPRGIVVGALGVAAIALILGVLAANSFSVVPTGNGSLGGGQAALAPAETSGVPSPGVRETPPLTGDTAPSAPDGVSPAPTSAPAAAAAALAVGATGVPTWQDVLGAWHGQALAAVRNTGDSPLTLDPAASRYDVLAPDGSAVAGGAFDAAVPPVLSPGDTGYLVAGFLLVSPPAGDLQVQVLPAATASDAPAVDLRVSDVRVAYPGDTVVVTGDVRNAGRATVTDGAVGVVLLDARGDPIAGVLDLASAGRLDEGEATPFRAAQPPAPPVTRGDVRRRVAAAWGTAAP